MLRRAGCRPACGERNATSFIAILFVILFAAPSNAQALGYASGGVAGYSGFFGRASGSFHAGTGVEIVANGHIGFGGEIGFFNRFAVGSGGVTIHLSSPTEGRGYTFMPVVTGGVSRFGIGDREFSAVTIGTGFHYWAADRVGFRIEFRDPFRPSVPIIVARRSTGSVRAGTPEKKGSGIFSISAIPPVVIGPLANYHY